MPEELETLIVKRDGGVVTITLNRPEKKNAMSGQLFEELHEVVSEVQRRDDDRVLVITGAGGDFCSGADLSAPSSPDAHPIDRMREIGDVALALHRLSKPAIAKVRGVAVGAGCNLALGCDLIAASEDARFSQIFARRGLSVDFGGSWLLPRLIGLHKAKELALLADILSADEAQAMGLVNRVVPDAELDDLVDDWARRLAAGPPIALAQSKRMLNDSLLTTMEKALEDEGRAQVANFATVDTAEARDAFLAKREPTFTGKSALG
jgi:enoyl-CoA hydratase/carnithine racemase